ncbi:hypothetical protein NDU88_005049 [Pleurodeles waltl]|uniref:Uncharacterized protein n=1 Tax=Pleurodeles waltl TaxID=8319 RepID=A0AAV7WZL1_PLEWA|nr:hypothetical protein NDU88_005049 [Pleurodeles waltl]
MRMEAARQGKDCLCQKLAEEIEEGHSGRQTGEGTVTQEEARCLGTKEKLMQKPRKRQKVDSRPAKKATKKG